jgi:hypothetical protein
VTIHEVRQRGGPIRAERGITAIASSWAGEASRQRWTGIAHKSGHVPCAKVLWQDDSMTEPLDRHPRASSVIGYGSALLVAVLGLIARAVAAHNDGNSWLDVISVLLLIVAGVLALMFALFAMFAWLDRVRTRALGAPTRLPTSLKSQPTRHSRGRPTHSLNSPPANVRNWSPAPT